MKYSLYSNIYFIILIFCKIINCYVIDFYPNICQECVRETYAKNNYDLSNCIELEEDFEINVLKREKNICDQIHSNINFVQTMQKGLSFIDEFSVSLKGLYFSNKNNETNFLNDEILQILKDYNLNEKYKFSIISIKSNFTEVSLYILNKNFLETFDNNKNKEYNNTNLLFNIRKVTPIISFKLKSLNSLDIIAISLIEKNNFYLKAFLISYFAQPLSMIRDILKNSIGRKNDRINTFVIIENSLLKNSLELEMDYKILLNEVKTNFVSLHDYFDNVFISRNNIKISNNYEMTLDNIISSQLRVFKKNQLNRKNNSQIPRFAEVNSKTDLYSELSIESLKNKFSNITDISNVLNCFNNTPNSMEKYMSTFSCIKNKIKTNDELSNLTRNEIDEKLQKYFSFMKADITFKDLILRKNFDKIILEKETNSNKNLSNINEDIKAKVNNNSKILNNFEYELSSASIKMNISSLLTILRKNCHLSLIKNTKCLFYLDFINFIVESFEMNEININNDKIIVLSENSLKLYDDKTKKIFDLPMTMWNSSHYAKTKLDVKNQENTNNLIDLKDQYKSQQFTFHINHSNIILLILILTLSFSIIYYIHTNNYLNDKVEISDEILIEYPRIQSILFYNEDSYYKTKNKNEFLNKKSFTFKLPAKEELINSLKELKERFSSINFKNYQKLLDIDNEILDNNSSFNSNLDSKIKSSLIDSSNIEDNFNYLAFQLNIAIDEIKLVFTQYDKVNREKNIKSFMKSNFFSILMFFTIKLCIMKKIYDEQILIWIVFSVFSIFTMVLSQIIAF